MSTVVQIGESFVGEGVNAAHVNTVLGDRSGPAGVAWATSLATPSQGHVPFVAVLRPGLPVKPLTLFVTKAAVDGDGHATMTWGAAQAGIAAGVADAVAEGVIAAEQADHWVLIAAVWVNPGAADGEAVYANNRVAAATALRAGAAGTPRLADVLAARFTPSNPFFTPES